MCYSVLVPVLDTRGQQNSASHMYCIYALIIVPLAVGLFLSCTTVFNIHLYYTELSVVASSSFNVFTSFLC